MMKKLATILLLALFVALPICNVSANGDIQTEYPLETMLVDYEFNDTSTGFNGLQMRNEAPTLTTEDGEGVALFEKVAGLTATMGVSFKSGEEAMLNLKEALQGGEVAFELRAKPEGIKEYLGFGNKMIEFNNNKINFNGKNVTTSTDGNWYKVACILDYSGATPALKKLEVNDVSYPLGKYTVPTIENLIGTSNTSLWTFLYPAYCEVGDKVYLDYIRIYSVKQLKYEGCNIDVNGMDRDERNIELYFNHPLDEISVIMSTSLTDEHGNYVNNTNGLGAEENTILFTLDEPLNYGGYYTINIDGLQERDDGNLVSISMTLPFFVENQPQYTFTEWEIGSSNGTLNGSVAVTNNLPKERKLLFLTQLYDEQDCLLSIQNSGEATMLSGAEAQTVNLFSNVSCPSAVKAKVFVFSESYQYILDSYTLEIER